MIELPYYSVNSIAKRSNSKKQMGLTKLKKSIARETAMAVASSYIGEPSARAAYRMGAKSVKKIKQVVRKRTSTASKKNVANGIPMMMTPRMKIFSQPTARGLDLSVPAMLYLKSFLDPFDQSVKNVGIPKPGTMPSFKCTGYCRGVGFIGKQGLGFAYFMPSLANDDICIGYSRTTYDQDYIASVATDTTAGGAYSPSCLGMPNLPFNRTTLTQTGTGSNADLIVEGRIVSASFRINYTGTTLNTSGQYYAYADPDLNSIVGSSHSSTTAQTEAYTVAELGAKDACEIKNADRSGISLSIIGANDNVNDYPFNTASNLRKTYPYANGYYQGPSGLIGGANAVIAITGIPGQSFYLEAVVHAEYTGPGVPQALLTQSFSDTVGYHAVQMIMARAQRRCASDARKSLRSCILAECAADGIRL